ncbi:hypothetical protein M5X11_08075 [Paenibacillus alginolyticus]|uniref:hypothetical protein n=1 Tax=Paenibacillus alginolyticus TaxID=59839 RepID=UPI0004286DA4|nr:hypothetical protein [Paenibacillus alginolyticus]MCY9664914.1 hypothetical protein [Paenibacillus alginolyticus]
MQLAKYRTRITRDKLVKYRHDPDTVNWQEIEQIRETQEQYYLPTVEMLDAVMKKHHSN